MVAKELFVLEKEEMVGKELFVLEEAPRWKHIQKADHEDLVDIFSKVGSIADETWTSRAEIRQWLADPVEDYRKLGEIISITDGGDHMTIIITKESL